MESSTILNALRDFPIIKVVDVIVHKVQVVFNVWQQMEA